VAGRDEQPDWRTHGADRGEGDSAAGLRHWQITGKDAADGVQDALELRCRHIDTARARERGRGRRPTPSSRAASAPRNPELTAIGEAHGKCAGQVALR
jgi:diketogulonate reductase-like aldo/keto reductase